MKKIKNIFKYVASVFLAILVVLCIYTFVMTDILKKDYVNVFGYTYFVVATGSMSGTIEVDDIIFVKLTKDVKKNDVITFQNKDGDIITHRLVKIEGEKYITKGDINNVSDEAIKKDQIIGKVTLIVSPSFILKSIAIFLIIFILLALVNFDNIVKKYIIRDGSKEEEKVPEEEPKKLTQILYEKFKAAEKIVAEKNKKQEMAIATPIPKTEVAPPVQQVAVPTPTIPQQVPVQQPTPVAQAPVEQVPIQPVQQVPIQPVVETIAEPIVTALPEIQPMPVAIESKVPEEIFVSPRKRYDDPSTGLTVTISLEEMEALNKQHEKDMEKNETVEVLEDYDEYFSYEPKQKKKKDSREKEMIDFIISILKCKNNTQKSRMNKRWLEKYRYVYKLCFLLIYDNIEDLTEEISKPPFKEIYDYDLDKVGLTEAIRNRIYDMPIYMFLRILTYAILYNDEEMFDGVYKIMKYKVMVDKNGEFKQLDNHDKNAEKQVKTLISFMKKVSTRFDNKNVFELDKIERMVKITKY